MNDFTRIIPFKKGKVPKSTENHVNPVLKTSALVNRRVNFDIARQHCTCSDVSRDRFCIPFCTVSMLCSI